MKQVSNIISVLSLLSFLSVSGMGQPLRYCWLPADHTGQSLKQRIAVPGGYRRITVTQGSFADWLRHLPFKNVHSPVRLYDGSLKSNQEAHHAVADMDVGSGNLQQCADAIIRLRAEYLYSRGELSRIRFCFSSGHPAEFSRWMAGYRPRIRGNSVTWIRSAAVDSGYENFRKYLETVFAYAGSYSLNRELNRVAGREEMRIGDVFIQGGFPGHAVLVLDMAVDGRSGRKIFLLGQSFMPAQDFHVLKNPGDSELSPWYDLEFGPVLETPEWQFRETDLRRF